VIEVKILPRWIPEAEELYDYKALNGSIMKGESNIYGAMGEVVVRHYFGETGIVLNVPCYDYDLIINNKKVDVKTKRTTVVPLPHYNCSVSDWNTRQKCDFYYFARVTESLSMAYLLGYIEKAKFYEKAVFKKKGERETPIFCFRGDGYHLPMSSLIKFEGDCIVDDFIMPYGKHKGKTFDQMPSSYLLWVAENWKEDCAINKKICEEADKEWQWREKMNEHWD
jgi:hypothetical protein